MKTKLCRMSGFKNATGNNSNYIKLSDDNKIKIMNATDVERTFTPNILRLNDTEGADPAMKAVLPTDSITRIIMVKHTRGF